MIPSCVSFLCNLVRAATLPFAPLPEDYRVWREAGEAGKWLVHSLRQVQASYWVFISLDLPGQVLDIVKSLTTELRLSGLNNILTFVVEETKFSLDNGIVKSPKKLGGCGVQVQQEGSS